MWIISRDWGPTCARPDGGCNRRASCVRKGPRQIGLAEIWRPVNPAPAWGRTGITPGKRVAPGSTNFEGKCATRQYYSDLWYLVGHGRPEGKPTRLPAEDSGNRSHNLDLASGCGLSCVVSLVVASGTYGIRIRSSTHHGLFRVVPGSAPCALGAQLAMADSPAGCHGDRRSLERQAGVGERDWSRTVGRLAECPCR